MKFVLPFADVAGVWIFMMTLFKVTYPLSLPQGQWNWLDGPCVWRNLHVSYFSSLFNISINANHQNPSKQQVMLSLHLFDSRVSFAMLPCPKRNGWWRRLCWYSIVFPRCCIEMLGQSGGNSKYQKQYHLIHTWASSFPLLQPYLPCRLSGKWFLLRMIFNTI